MRLVGKVVHAQLKSTNKELNMFSKLEKTFQSFKNPSYLQSSMMLLLFFASWGVWWSFFQLWLTSPEHGLGLSGESVGIIFSANSFVTLVLMFFYGALQDKLQLKRTLLIVCAVISSLVGPFFVWIYAPLLKSSFTLGLIVGSVVLSAGFLAAVGVYEAVTERFSRQFNFQYGLARAWGSFGYAIVALLAGFLFVIDPKLNFWAGSFFGALLCLNLIFWRPKAEKEANLYQQHHAEEDQTPSIKEMLDLLKLPELWVIIIFIMFSWTFYTVYDQQMFPQFYTDLFADEKLGQRVYGTLNSIQVFCEALMMCVVPFIMLKIGVRSTLLLGVIIMAIRISLSGLFTDPVIVSFIKLLHALEVPLFVLPMFRYFTLHFITKLSVTLYMIGFQMAAQIGQVILSTPLGILRDKIGYSHTFIVIAMIVIISGIFAFFTLKKDDEDVHGDPFIRS